MHGTVYNVATKDGNGVTCTEVQDQAMEVRRFWEGEVLHGPRWGLPRTKKQSTRVETDEFLVGGSDGEATKFSQSVQA